MVAVFGPASAFLGALERAGITAIQPTGFEHLNQYAAVVVTAAAYPAPMPLDPAVAEYVRGGGTAYVEFATADGFLPEGTVRIAHTERIFSTGLKGLGELSILDEHASRFQDVIAPGNCFELLAYGNVAGTHQAVFGPPGKTFPALLDISVDSGRLLYATTALSHYLTGNYRPRRRWSRLFDILVAGSHRYRGPAGGRGLHRAAELGRLR